MNEWKVGDYCMMRGSAVRLDTQSEDRFAVTYVQIIEHEGGIRVISGGGSCFWGRDDLHPIADAGYKVHRPTRATVYRVRLESVFAPLSSNQ